MSIYAALATGLANVVKSWFDSRAAKFQAEAEFQQQLAKQEADWDIVALQQAQHSWKDEFITIIIFSPLIVAWFDAGRAMEWVTFVQELPHFYQFFMAGIIAASFGLRWFFKDQAFKVGKDRYDQESERQGPSVPPLEVNTSVTRDSGSKKQSNGIRRRR